MFPNFIRKQSIFLQLLVTLTSTKSPLLGTGRRRDPIRGAQAPSPSTAARLRPSPARPLPPCAPLPPAARRPLAQRACALCGRRLHPPPCAPRGYGLRPAGASVSLVQPAPCCCRPSPPAVVAHCSSPPIATDW